MLQIVTKALDGWPIGGIVPEMKAIDTESREMLAWFRKELGCTSARITVSGGFVNVNARWERDANVIGTMRVRVPTVQHSGRYGEVFTALFGLPDGEYLAVA